MNLFYVENVSQTYQRSVRRWSQKYRSISIFKENFEIIVHALDKLSKDGNTAKRKVAFQLYAVANKSIFL